MLVVERVSNGRQIVRCRKKWNPSREERAYKAKQMFRERKIPTVRT